MSCDDVYFPKMKWVVDRKKNGKDDFAYFRRKISGRIIKERREIIQIAIFIGECKVLWCFKFICRSHHSSHSRRIRLTLRQNYSSSKE